MHLKIKGLVIYFINLPPQINKAYEKMEPSPKPFMALHDDVDAYASAGTGY
jgi:hypothetical protein